MGLKHLVVAQHSKNMNSFYHLPEAKVKDALCQGTACFVARAQDPERWNVQLEHREIACTASESATVHLCALPPVYCRDIPGRAYVGRISPPW